MNDKLESILAEAQLARKYSYRIYEQFKRRIEELGLSAGDYLRAIVRLADILRV